MSGQIIQLGAPGQFFALSENGERSLLPPVEAAPAAAEPVPVPAKGKPKAGQVIARIGAEPPTRRSYAAELRDRRKFLEREVKRLRRFEDELREVDQMLAAIKTPARKPS